MKPSLKVLGVLFVTTILVVWIGVSWRNGWFPFAANTLTKAELLQQAIDSTTAVGTPQSIPDELLENTTAKGSPKYSTTTTAKVIESTTAL
ncbi:hypothetical protein A3G63_00340 [Candidatus Kaiserbacteria bacterium RIFCSPLOWO2_12_FULL_52_8]|uniref:Uncharacterized protein n=1 Tax=Candidatus Kaiserbacteria bacterium RIFCSPHIGHO2_01_FULL_53_31 TaxID=1798481 RepID=A0A1F6CIH9_9BACT|nr:MAG: hypothetical protein A2678_02230 [Candidatus Kaiserbacteria bacterium RIFCSPHIGHO2_01_FULL_53_31]OGG92609.1 MAG: hypothetical protein A3G63_00340 [Candidatus Kaiserbacteria bacterium RIFCSPLOWO2_12_FULL_52_8]